MKKTPLFALACAATAMFCMEAKGAVTLSDITVTPNSITFTISGNLPASTTGGENVLVLTNPVTGESPGFVLEDFAFPTSNSFTGSQTLGGIFTSGSSYGDVIFIQFPADLASSAALNGTFSATWSGAPLDPTAVTSLDLYWGNTSGPTTGVYLGSMAVVPEPSSVILLLGGVAIAGLRRRRR